MSARLQGKNLFKAVETGDFAEVQRCVDKGADVDGRNKEGQTPLYISTRNGHVDVVKVLVENGANVRAADKVRGWAPLHWAALNGHVDVVKMLLEKGADVNTADKFGYMPLHVASNYGHDDVAKMLVENAASVNAPADNGSTPLHIASRYGHVKVAERLLAAGADLFALDKDGQTPRDVPTIRNRPTVVDALDQCAQDRALAYFCDADLAMAEKYATLVVTTLTLHKTAFAWIGDNLLDQQGKYKQAKTAFALGLERSPLDDDCISGLVKCLTVQVAATFTPGAARHLAQDPSFETFLESDGSMAIFRSVVDNPALYHDHKPLLEPVLTYLLDLSNDEN